MGTYMRWKRPSVRSTTLLIALGAMIALPLSVMIALVFSLGRAAAPPPHPAPLPRTVTPGSIARWAPTTLRVQTDALGIDPAWPNRLYAGTPDGLWQSADAGATWTRAMVVAPPPEFLSFAAITMGDRLYAGASDGTIYARDAGGTWRRIVPSLDGNSVFSLAGVPDAAPTLLAGTSNGIYRITFAAGRWHVGLVTRTGGSSVTSILVLPWKPRVVYASIFGSSPPVLRSGDSGRRWSSYMQGLPSALPSEQLLAVAALSKSVILSSMGIGVWQITPGHGWSEISAGLPERHAMPLAVDTRGGVRLYAGTMGSGVYTRAASQPWRRLGNQLVGPAYIDLGLQVAGVGERYLVVATSQGVFRRALSG